MPGVCGVDVVDAALALGGEHRRELLPQCGRAGGRAGQEVGVAGVRRVVALDEVADVDPVLPGAGDEPPPRLRILRRRPVGRRSASWSSRLCSSSPSRSAAHPARLTCISTVGAERLPGAGPYGPGLGAEGPTCSACMPGTPRLLHGCMAAWRRLLGVDLGHDLCAAALWRPQHTANRAHARSRPGASPAWCVRAGGLRSRSCVGGPRAAGLPRAAAGGPIPRSP